MRILFLLSGHIWRHTLPEGFREAGHDTLVISAGSTEEISATLSQYRPHIAISIGWGKEQNKKNQLVIRRCLKEAHVPHIYWSVEDPGYTLEFSLPLIQRMQPDFVFTICRKTVLYFQRLGMKAAYMDFGVSPQIHRSIACEQLYDIAVVANAYPGLLSKHPNHFRFRSLRILVEPLLMQNIRVDFWGRGWQELRSILQWDIPSEWMHPPLDYQNTAKLYNCSNITLGLQNYTDQVTQRTYEVLGSGGFLFTVDTPGVRAVFSPDKDLVCSSSPDQTLELLRHYQMHPDRRRTIAAQGQKSADAHTYKHRAEYMLAILKQARIIAKD